jgi:hypothetical protein
MQMANTRRATHEAAKTGGNGAGVGGSGENNVNHNETHPEPHLLPPPPLTAEVFFAQLLGSQRNTEQSQKNMEDFLRIIANNVQRGNNQGGGNGVNQYSNFKDSWTLDHQFLRKQQSHLTLKNGSTLWKISSMC